MLGKIYVAGGFPGTSSAEVFDSSGWSVLPTMNRVRSASVTAIFQDKFAILGGHVSVEVFDPATSAWSNTTIPSMKLVPSRSYFTAVSSSF